MNPFTILIQLAWNSLNVETLTLALMLSISFPFGDAICGTSTGKLIYSLVDRFERIIPYKWDFSAAAPRRRHPAAAPRRCCPKVLSRIKTRRDGSLEEWTVPSWTFLTEVVMHYEIFFLNTVDLLIFGIYSLNLSLKNISKTVKNKFLLIYTKD